LLVTRAHPLLQLLAFLAGKPNAQLQQFTRCYFYLPSKPCLRPFPLPGPPLLYLQPLSLLLPTLRSSARSGFRARIRWSAKGPTAQTGTVEHCLALAIRIAGRSHSPITAPASHGFWGLKHSIIEAVFGSGNRPCADSCGPRFGLSIWWRHGALPRCPARRRPACMNK
jgi:hypothetical protein